jgi:two-component system cell cycle sensor histidine kinase/response regulator CckA
LPLVPGEFFPSLLDSLLDGIVTIDASGRINGFNRAAERLFGYRRSEILGQDVTALIPLPYRRGHDVQFGHYLRTGESSILGRPQRVEGRHKDGTTFYCELTITEFAVDGERCFAGVAREVGERERTPVARGEARLRHIIDSLSALVAVYSTDGVMLDVNEAALRAGGVSRADALGRRIDQTPWVAHSPAEGGRALEMVRRAAAGETVRGELEIRVADGGVRFLDVILGPLRDPSGAIVEVLTSGIDVTDRRRAEGEVQHRLRQQEAVARLGALAIKESDLPTLLTTAVDLTRDVLGSDRCTVALEIGPGTRPATAVRDGLGVRSLSAAIEGRRGPYGVLAADARPPHRFREDDRHFLQSIANVLADVVRGVQAEEQLAHERAFSETALESLPGLIVVADERGRMVRWNQAMERTTGYDRDELARLGPIGVIAPDEQALVLARFQDIFEQGHSTVEAHLQTRDGRRIPMLFSARRITLQGTPHMLGVALDISDRRRLEEQLRHSQKMEALGQLAGGVAHDFNNLLTVIIGFSGLTLATLPDGDPNRANIEAVTEAANSAAALTRQLLAFSRRTMMEPVVLDLNAVVSDTETMLRRLIGEDVQLTTELAPDLPNVRGDVGLVTQVLMNLAVNARDAMPLGGSLTIATRRFEPPGQRVAAGHGSAGAEALLIIRDTGTGMTPEVRERAFEPFFTTKSVGRGSGLGLAVVHGIVEQSGARIDLESEPGAGTTFVIAFPAVDAPVPAAPVSIGTAPVGSETILLVEDEDGVRRLARTILEQQGYRVVEAASGEDAVRLMDRYTGPLDLVVTDVVMPGIDGRDVADAVRAQFPSAKVLYLSGYTSDAVVRHGILHHEVAFLQKPFSAAGLAAKVREVLSEG